MSQLVEDISHFSGVVNDPNAVYPGYSFYNFTIFFVMLEYQLETVGKQLR